MLRQVMRKGLGALGTLVLAVAIPLSVQAQGQIVGTVTHAESGAPIAAVQLSVQGTTLGSTTGADGTFTIANVPAGTHTVVAQRLGFQQVQQSNVTVTAGQPTTLELTMSPAVLALQGIVATGLVDPVEGVRSPISVGRVDREMMPIPVAGSAVQNLQGRMAGVTIARGSGQPGSEVSIQLRSPTSLTTSGRSVEPLIVVDGVILGTGGTSNIESMDIESIEIVRGAAAASLYGSRANAGVISITTTRGQGLEMGQTQFSARSEMGVSTEIGDPRQPTHHQYLVDNPANPTTYVDLDGNPVNRANRIAPLPAVAFMDVPYPGPVYDNFRGVFQPAGFQSHNFMVSQNTADTNFAITLNRYIERGPLPNNDGFERNSFRVNLDHRFLNTLSLGISAYHARDHRDNTSGLSFTDLFRVPPDIDLTRKDADGDFLRIPDPEVNLINPLWIMGSREADRNRARTLGSANLRWEPASWLSLSGTASYDRQDSKTRTWIPKGTPVGFEDAESDGSISFSSSLSDTWNADTQIQARRDFGALNFRATLRASIEQDQNEAHGSSGSDFFVQGVPRINSAQNRDASSEQSEVRALGYLWDNAFNYADKYIASILVRRDGSSLFGPENRWHNYYRTAFAWRLGQEDWFNLPNVDEFKLSYARGTAGSRPGFAHQYELWSSGASGISKSTLGNRNLRPEHSLEQEVSLEMILFGRVGVELNQAWQRTSDQLILLELPSFTGYSDQWTNGGTLTGYTTELTVEAQVVTTPRVMWQTMVVGDRTRGKLEEWPFPCTSPAWLQRCEGVETGMIWGFVFAEDVSQLTDPIIWPSGTGRPNTCHHDCSAAGHAHEFMVNDEGYLVWVGEGNHYTEGFSKDLWGTSTNIGGRNYLWGIPFNLVDPNGGSVRTQMGNAAHANLGWINNVSFGALSLHAHLHSKIGGHVINREMQLATAEFRSPEQDQGGKPDPLKKPMQYYTIVQSGSSGSTYYMEDGSYLKLRTLSANYRLTPSQLTRVGLGNLGVRTMQIGVIGRDILTLTGYRGWDPEHGLSPAGQAQTASAGYPPTRSFTAEVAITF